MFSATRIRRLPMPPKRSGEFGFDAAARPRKSTAFKLPRLPIPMLNATFQKYLKSLMPFFLEDAARGGPPFEKLYAEYEQNFKVYQRKNNIIWKNQERLMELDAQSPNNWLDDNLWLKKAYLESREHLLVNSNWWLALQNDTNIPDDVLSGKSTHYVAEGVTSWQIRRAAWLVHRIVDFKRQLERQEVYPETTRTGLWFQHAAAKVFNLCRVPGTELDSLTEPPVEPAQSSPATRQIVVMLHDWFYVVDVCDQNGQVLPPVAIEKRLRFVVADVDKMLKHGQTAVPIGILSADRRDVWAENYKHLCSLGDTNQATIKTIHRSLFALSLDPYTYTLPEHEARIRKSDAQAELDAHLHNVRSGRGNARNRFFDKTFTLIVESNTRAGVMGEHSPVDALVPSIIAEYALVEGLDETAFAGTSLDLKPEAASLESEDGWRQLSWVVDDRIKGQCIEAEETAKKIIADSDDSVFWFTHYGADLIKESYGFSPDAYIQMALQLAWYRTRGCFTAVYETALTRLFHHGRTETIRSFTTESRAFVLGMMDGSTSPFKRLELLRRAIQTHVALTREAATGQGIDRHLLGLRCMPFAELGPMWKDEYYLKSQEWKLSTSGLSAGHLFRGTGFGAPYHDSYGINYLAGPDVIKFGVESKHSCPETSTAGFIEAINTALLDLQNVCVTGVKDKPPAKL